MISTVPLLNRPHYQTTLNTRNRWIERGGTPMAPTAPISPIFSPAFPTVDDDDDDLPF